MIPIERIVIGTQIFRNGHNLNRLFEHPTKPISVDDSGLNSKSDDPSRELIHYHQHPIRPQPRRFTSKQ